MQSLKNIKSLAAVLLLLLTMGSLLSTRNNRNCISWDVFGTYLYLPALFYHNDIELSNRDWVDALRKKYDASGTLYQVHSLENGNNVIQYSSGQAVLMLPAFVAGHFIAAALGAEQDGLSYPYQLSVAVWSFVMVVVGLFYLRKLLLLFFTDAMSAVIVLLLAFGTNYFVQTTGGISTSHTYLFALYAVFLFYVATWHQSCRIVHFILLSLALGLMCLTRPTELLAVFIPMFWHCTSPKQVWIKWKGRKKELLIFMLIMIVCAMPQLIYWKYISSHWLVMSYANPGEGFDFLTPHTFNFLFSYRKGLFVYTPLLMISLLGFVYLWKQKREIFWSLFLFFIVNLYVVSSWSCWWYAHSYGQRSVVHILPVFALLLGFMLHYLMQRKWTVYAGSLVISCCMVLNVFQSWQYTHFIIDGSRMTREYYWKIFGKTEVDESWKSLLMIDRSLTGEMNFSHRENYTEKEIFNFRTGKLKDVEQTVMLDSINEQVQVLDAEHSFSKGWQMKWTQLTKADHNWFFVEAEFYAPSDFKVEDVCLVTCADHKGGVYGYHAPNIAPDSLKLNAWNTISYFYITPEIWRRGDKVLSYIWYRGKSKVYLRQHKITQFEPKKK
jgi:MFS family permease